MPNEIVQLRNLSIIGTSLSPSFVRTNVQPLMAAMPYKALLERTNAVCQKLDRLDLFDRVEMSFIKGTTLPSPDILDAQIAFQEKPPAAILAESWLGFQDNTVVGSAASAYRREIRASSTTCRDFQHLGGIFWDAVKESVFPFKQERKQGLTFASVASR